MDNIYKINRSIADNIKTVYYDSPTGCLEVQCTEQGLRAVNFVEKQIIEQNINIHTTLTIKQLQEYFDGKRTTFDMPLDIEGTAFQQQVWKALLNIPYGKTKSYMDIAKAVGNPKTIRAVGLANGQNKIAIIIPCHRVIGSDGSLTGYAGGLSRKKWLLEFETPSTQKTLF